jgi:glycosyltransferase involved in cell wall biosynthesis
MAAGDGSPAWLWRRPYVLEVPVIPPLSVVMPARNALPYLDSSLESILGQSFGDFEFVIRDDGSTDGTTEALRAWAARDRRIRLFEGPQLGLAGSSNWVVRKARSPLVARMDADDVARPDRLERQVALLRDSPDVVLVGSLADTIDGDGRRIRPADFWRVARRSCFPPFPHTSITFRRAAFDAVGGYRAQCEYWEDLDFFLRMAERGRIAVIADDLVSHRQSRVSSRQVPADEERIEDAVDRMYQCLAVYGRGGRYEPLLAREPAAPAARLRPMTFVSIHSNRLWAGQRPRIAARLLRRARLGFDRESLVALVWATLAQGAPPLLRALMRGVVKARNAAVRDRVRRGEVHDWRPYLPARAVRSGADEVPVTLPAPLA